MSQEYIAKIEQKIGITFNDKDLLKRAFVHKSFSKEWNNTRLAFYGDALLEGIVREYIVKKCEDGSKLLTVLRSHLASNEVCALVVDRLGLSGCMLVSDKWKQYLIGTLRQSDTINGTLIEAIVGAVALDQGAETARIFLKRVYTPILEEAHRNMGRDRYAWLYKLTKETFGVVTRFSRPRIEPYGQNQETRRMMSIDLRIGEKIAVQGIGFNKKEARRNAIRKALNILENRKRDV